MKSGSFVDLFHGRLAALDALLVLCWLSGVCLGCTCGALSDLAVPNQLLTFLNYSSGIVWFSMPYFDLVIVWMLWWINGGDLILPFSFVKGFVDAFVLCLLLSAPGCLGWPCLLIAFCQQFLLAPARFNLWRWILRDFYVSNTLWLTVLYCICVFLCFVFLSVF